MSSSCPSFNSGGVQFISQLFTPPITTIQYQPVFYNTTTPSSVSYYNDNIMSNSGTTYTPPSCNKISYTYNTTGENTKIGLISSLTLSSSSNINFVNNTTESVLGHIQSVYVPPNMVVIITDNYSNSNVHNCLCLIGSWGYIELNNNVNINDSDYQLTSSQFNNNVNIINVIADSQQSNYGVIPITSSNPNMSWINSTNPIYINFCYKCFYNTNGDVIPVYWDYYLALGCNNLISNYSGAYIPYISSACSNNNNAKSCDNIVSTYCSSPQGKKDNIICGCYNSIANSTNGKPITCASGICGPTSTNYVPSQFRCAGCTDVILSCRQNIIENGSGSVNIGNINMDCNQIAGVKDKTTTNIISQTFTSITNFISTHIFISAIGFIILIGFIIILSIIIIKKKQLKNQNIPTII